MSPPLILVDADACPVKEEIYKVAWRLEVPVTLVSNQHLRVPQHPLVDKVVVGAGFDAADDWIAEASGPATVVIGPNGKPFTAASIGAAVATRAIMADLRAGMDGPGGGPKHKAMATPWKAKPRRPG